jgi:hypothetical protein
MRFCTGAAPVTFFSITWHATQRRAALPSDMPVFLTFHIVRTLPSPGGQARTELEKNVFFARLVLRHLGRAGYRASVGAMDGAT